MISARAVAVAYCNGTPLRDEIEARDPLRLVEAVDAVERALIQRFGTGELEGKFQALIVDAG